MPSCDPTGAPAEPSGIGVWAESWIGMDPANEEDMSDGLTEAVSEASEEEVNACCRPLSTRAMSISF